jgi:hypothetical protein
MIRPAKSASDRFTAAVLALSLASGLLAAHGGAADEPLSANAPNPEIRRIFVPEDRPGLWPPGDWQPTPLAELEKQIDAARLRPAPYIDHAEYRARFVDGEFRDGRFAWSIRRPESADRLLRLGELNLNVAGLTWSDLASREERETVVCGNLPQGPAALLVDRPECGLEGQWNLDGRKLAASSEFEFVVAPATTSQLRILVPAGMVVSSSGGESPSPAPALEAGWTEWQVRFGSRTRTRLRIAPATNRAAARPLNIVRSNVSYIVRAEAVRLFAEFDLEALESPLREVRLLVDPEIQVTSIEYGDGGIISWQIEPSDQGPVIIIPLPAQISGVGPALQVQAISQIKQFGAWTLPGLRLQNFVEADAKVTLRLQPPLTAADIRSEGYRQLSLTTGAEGESMLFRKLRPGAAITVVPAETKPDLACRVISLLQADRGLWNLTCQLEWSASAGATYSVTCRIPPMWEIIDVRPAADQAGDVELTGREIEETESGGRLLRVYFRNALHAGRPHSFRVTARRLPPGPEERIIVPPLIPGDTSDVEQFTVVATGRDSRPAMELGPALEQIGVRSLAPDVRNLDFLAARLADQSSHLLVLRTLGPATGAGLRIESLEQGRGAVQAENGSDGGPPVPSRPVQDPASLPSGSVPMSLHVTAKISGSSSGFDEYRAEIGLAAWNESHPLRFRFEEPLELTAASVGGRRVAADRDQRTWTIAYPSTSTGVTPPLGDQVIEIEYRVPATLHGGPNSRRLSFPVLEGDLLRFDLTLVVPDNLRLAGAPESLRFSGLEVESTWRNRLLGPFARPAEEPLFNPFDRTTWNRRLTGMAKRGLGGEHSKQIFRSTAAVLPREVRIVVWQGAEVVWLTIAATALCSLVCVLLRVVQFRWGQFSWSRAAGAGLAASLCAAVLVLSPVNAEIAGGALTGLVLASLLPESFLRVAGRRDPAGQAVPTGSTQSFVPLALAVLVGGTCCINAELRAQEPRPPRPVNASSVIPPSRPTFDVLIPVNASGTPAGKNPVAYVRHELADYLRQAAGIDTLPTYLIGASTYDGRLDESRQLTIRATFDVHVMADDPIVQVALPLRNVNLGGRDACLVDGRPHPLTTSGDGRSIVLELAGPPPRPEAPQGPQNDAGVEPAADSSLPAPLAAGLRVRTHRVELQIQPPTDVVHDDLFTAAIVILSSTRTRATISASPMPAVAGILSGDSQRRSIPAAVSVLNRPVLRPSPTRQLIFYWSEVGGQETPLPAETQADVSCLADLSSELIFLRYHASYRVLSGQLDSLAWYVPPGQVLQSVQAPQLSSYRFRLLPDGGREMLIEFARPQGEDFSLTATFVEELDRETGAIRLALVDPLRLEDPSRKKVGLRFHQFALRHPSDLQVGISAAGADQAVKPRSVDQFLKEWNADGARPQQAFELDRNFVLNLAVEKKSISPAVRRSSVGWVRPGRLDWTYLAEVEQPVIPRFVYRLQVDPRLRIRKVSVQEDGAERLLRWSHLRDTLILFLNDRATRTQTVRVEASLPLAADQEIELPRIQFVGAVPGPERMVLYHDPDVEVRLANPNDFPLPPDTAAGSGREDGQLAVRLDVLPEQANPRVIVERSLPHVSAEVALVLARDTGVWQMTAGVAFHVASGRVTEFVIEVPAALAPGLEIASTTPASTTQLPEVDGRVKLLFHPDEPIKQQFVAILTHRPDLTAGVWTPPRIVADNTERTASLLVIPAGSLQPADAALEPPEQVVPDWIKDVAPLTAVGQFNLYQWDAALSDVEFRTPRTDAEASVETARLDVWLDRDGAVRGWLGMKLSGSWPQRIGLAWPATCRPTSLFVADEFRPLPAVDQSGGRFEILLPRDAKDNLVWLSWVDEATVHPLLSERFAPRWPWPIRLSVERCLVNLHAPAQIRFDAPASQIVPATASPDRYLPSLTTALAPAGEADDANGVWISLPTSPTGSAPSLGNSLRVINDGSRKWLLSLALLLGACFFFWKCDPLRGWLTRHETTCWLSLAVLWWLWLEPGWFSLAIASWAAALAVLRQRRPQPASSHWQALDTTTRAASYTQP